MRDAQQSFESVHGLVAAVFGLVVAGAAHADAQSTTHVVDIPTRGVVQRYLHVRPEAPVATLVFLPGTNGILGIRNDGSMPTLAGRCGPLARNREAFAARGFALALVDQASDGKIRQPEDIRAVVAHLRERDRVPTWIVGGSAAAGAALNFVIDSPPEEPLGLVIFSPWQPDLSRAARLRRPTLIVQHRDDAGAAPFVDALLVALSGALDVEHVVLSGGVAGGECGGHHLFIGIDAELVDVIARFIGDHHRFDANPKQGRP